MTLIKDLRLKLGLEPRQLANAAGISIEEYYDLEDLEDELHIASSVASIARLAQALGVKPSSFYAGTSSGILSPAELALAIAQYVRDSNKSLGVLEEEVGWDLGEAVANPSKFLDFNADGLRDVCKAVGVNWLDLLDGVVA